MKMRRLALGTLCVFALNGCGGGGGGSPPQTYGLNWDQSTYTITTVPGSGHAASVNANVHITSSGVLPSSLAIDIAPYGASGANPTASNGPFWMNTQNIVPVPIAASPDGSGNYPLGAYTFTATMHIGAATYTSTTVVIVQ